MAPLMIFILRCQVWKCDFLIVIVCSPGATSTIDGVLPTKLPSISISAFAGVEDTEIFPDVPASLVLVVADTGMSVGAGAGVARN